jgi:hypothetical protein
LWDRDIKISPKIHAVKLKNFLEESLKVKHSTAAASRTTITTVTTTMYIMEFNKMHL